LEILLTQSNSFETKLDLLATQQAQKIAQINLYKALGGGWK
jgi:outer membrane protein TolC